MDEGHFRSCNSSDWHFQIWNGLEGFQILTSSISPPDAQMVECWHFYSLALSLSLPIYLQILQPSTLNMIILDSGALGVTSYICIVSVFFYARNKSSRSCNCRMKIISYCTYSIATISICLPFYNKHKQVAVAAWLECWLVAGLSPGHDNL